MAHGWTNASSGRVTPLIVHITPGNPAHLQMMSQPTFHMRSGIRHRTNHIDLKNRKDPAEHSSALASGDRVDRLPIVGFARPPRLLSAWMAISMLLLCLANKMACSAHAIDSAALSARSASHLVRAASKPLLEVFQVYPPVLTVTPEGTLEITDGSSNATVDVIPSSNATCQQTLVVHSFGSSYGQPYVGPYTPPSCSFNRVTWNLTVEAAGRQYDRLGSVSFGDIELLRTSTAEPTANGIKWTYLKDMTSFLPLFKEDQTIIFDLGNIITDVYTAPFNVTLTASFFTADDSVRPADLVVPISKRQGAAGQPSYFTVPSDTASNDLTIPRNVKRAVFTVAATGQSQEEFWWSNVLQSEVNTFPAYGTLYGYSPFREVQLYIDGMLAGVAWPFPIIFTGGVVPGLWRPIVGIDAFDLKEDEIDITPWLPLLCDGNAHNFTIRVSGLNDTGNGTATLSETTDTYWWVSGKVFIWLDELEHVTTGQGPTRVTPDPQLQVSSEIYKAANGTNNTLIYNVQAQRSLFFSSTINLSNGSSRATWSQSLTYSNTGNFTDNANVETNTQSTTGYDVSSSGYARKFSYPLYAYSTAAQVADNLTLFAIVSRGKDMQTLGQPVFPTGLESFAGAAFVHGMYGSFEGASLSTTQNGTATYMANETASTSYSFGTTEQDMTFAGVRATSGRTQYGFPTITQSEELFHRHALAVNGSVVEDEETLIETSVGHEHGVPVGSGRGPPLSGFPGRGARLDAFGEGQKVLG